MGTSTGEKTSTRWTLSIPVDRLQRGWWTCMRQASGVLPFKSKLVVATMIRLSARPKLQLAAVFLALSNTAQCCPNEKRWENFSDISFSSEPASTIHIKRFTDGVYARVERHGSTKEMYQINNGAYLYKGYDPSKYKGPSPFFMLDMPVGMLLSFLAHYFPSPCSLNPAPRDFSYSSASGKTLMAVTGTAHLVNTSTVLFELLAVEQTEGGTTIKTSGRVTFLDIVPAPTDLNISDWIVLGTYPKGSQNHDTQPSAPEERSAGKPATRP
jgi:hypothetical protein